MLWGPSVRVLGPEMHTVGSLAPQRRLQTQTTAMNRAGRYWFKDRSYDLENPATETRPLRHRYNRAKLHRRLVQYTGVMRVKTPQIVWNEKQPVLTLDFHPSGILATGGMDQESGVKLWQVSKGEDGNPTVTHISSLEHTRSVNCLRFAPTGQQLATAGDNGELMLWKPCDPEQLFGSDNGTAATWKAFAPLRGHTDDVFDIAWAPDASALVSGSMEKAAIFWDIGSKQGRSRWDHHRHYVQGVAWDPAQQFLVTQSSDRTCKVYGLRPPAVGAKKSKPAPGNQLASSLAREFVLKHTISKQNMPLQTQSEGGVKVNRPSMFHDENAALFFRRLAWSPDGSLLLAPLGMHKALPDSAVVNTTYVFSRQCWTRPLMHLPVSNKKSVAVRFSPVLYKLLPAEDDGDSRPTVIDLPYRMVFAVATEDSVIIYETQHMAPVAIFGALHCAQITDLSWSSDGRWLAVSSFDCYCSLAVFDDGELGTPVKADAMPPHIAQRMASAAKRAPVPDSEPHANKPATNPQMSPVEGSTPKPGVSSGKSSVGAKRRIEPVPTYPADRASAMDTPRAAKRPHPDTATPQAGCMSQATGCCDDAEQPTLGSQTPAEPHAVQDNLMTRTSAQPASTLSQNSQSQPDSAAGADSTTTKALRPPRTITPVAVPSATPSAADSGALGGSGVASKQASQPLQPRRITPMPVNEQASANTLDATMGSKLASTGEAEAVQVCAVNATTAGKPRRVVPEALGATGGRTATVASASPGATGAAGPTAQQRPAFSVAALAAAAGRQAVLKDAQQ